MILLGIIAVKFSLIDKVGTEMSYLANSTGKYISKELDFKQKRISKTRKQFEDRFSEDED
jgi:hypothetical protein